MRSASVFFAKWALGEWNPFTVLCAVYLAVSKRTIRAFAQNATDGDARQNRNCFIPDSAFSALYSFAFLGGQSYHVCAGYLALLLAMTCVEGFMFSKIKRPQLADFVRLLAVLQCK